MRDVKAVAAQLRVVGRGQVDAEGEDGEGRGDEERVDEDGAVVANHLRRQGGHGLRILRRELSSFYFAL